MNTNKTLSILAILSVFSISNIIFSSAQADTFLGADIELGLWSPSYDTSGSNGNISGKSQSIFASATIEHPVPLIPNLKLSVSEVNNDTYEYTKLDFTAYYEILDNDTLSIDLGVGVTQFSDGKFLNQPFSGSIPHVYADAEIALPLISSTLYSDIHYLSYNDSKITDAIVGLRYDLNLIALDLGFKAGYRVQSFDTKDFDDLSFNVKTDGYFIGLHADF